MLTELAERSRVPQETISKIEAGKTGGIDFDNLERLADALSQVGNRTEASPTERGCCGGWLEGRRHAAHVLHGGR